MVWRMDGSLAMEADWKPTEWKGIEIGLNRIPSQIYRHDVFLFLLVLSTH
jgi:hypothetical protein